MALFDKIKAAVKGNAVLKEYEVGTQIASAGPGLLWRVCRGVKRTTRKEVAVFILEKKCRQIEKLPRKEREPFLEVLRQGPLQLSRLRHPRLLTIDHQLEESNDILAYATEPVTACLANVLGNVSNFTGPLPAEVKDLQLSPLEMKYGLLQIADALSFIHADAKLVHGSLTPECVFLSSGGLWKVAGFEFALSLAESTEVEVTGWQAACPALCQRPLNYVAPEFVISKHVSRCSDLFSFGMLTYAVYNAGRVLCDHGNTVTQYTRNMEWLSRCPLQSLSNVPEELRETVKAMLCVEPAVRPDAVTVAKSDFFAGDPQLSVLVYLDNLYEKPELEKSQFFKTLPKVITNYPKRLLLQFVLPALTAEFVDRRMIPFVLPNILLVAEGLTSDEYLTHVLPSLLPVFQMEEPVQIPLILLQRMDLLLQKTSAGSIREHIVPFIHSTLASNSVKVQELCIGVLPNFAEMLDFASLNKSIVSRLLSLLTSTPSLSLRVKVLVCLGQMLNALDREVVLGQVLPQLAGLQSREPAVLMSTLGIYHAVFHSKKFTVTRQYLASSVIPHLLSLSLATSLNVTQYNQFTSLIHETLKAVESEHRAHLEHLGKMEEQTISTVAMAGERPESSDLTMGQGHFLSKNFNAERSSLVRKSLDSISPTPAIASSTASSSFAPKPPSSQAPPPASIPESWAIESDPLLGQSSMQTSAGAEQPWQKAAQMQTKHSSAASAAVLTTQSQPSLLGVQSRSSAHTSNSLYQSRAAPIEPPLQPQNASVSDRLLRPTPTAHTIGPSSSSDLQPTASATLFSGMSLAPSAPSSLSGAPRPSLPHPRPMPNSPQWHHNTSALAPSAAPQHPPAAPTPTLQQPQAPSLFTNMSMGYSAQQPQQGASAAMLQPALMPTRLAPQQAPYESSNQTQMPSFAHQSYHSSIAPAPVTASGGGGALWGGQGTAHMFTAQPPSVTPLSKQDLEDLLS